MQPDQVIVVVMAVWLQIDSDETVVIDEILVEMISLPLCTSDFNILKIKFYL